jgi:hypothetical protein
MFHTFIQFKPLVLSSHKQCSKILLLLNQWLEALVRSALRSAAPTLVAEGNYV